MPRKKTKKQEPDSVYFLKIVLFFIVGSIWLRIDSVDVPAGLQSVPIGLVLGLLFASHDHFKIDRKVEYAVLLGASIVSFVAPTGLVMQF